MKLNFRIGKNMWYEQLYCILLSWYCFHSVLASSYVDSVMWYNVSVVSSFIRVTFPLILVVMFLIKMIKVRDLKKKQFTIIFTICLVVGLVFFSIHSTDLIMVFGFLIAYPIETDIIKVAGFDFWGHALAILIVMEQFYRGYITEYVRRRNGILRHSIGFVSANAFANCVAFTILVYFYYKGKNWKMRDSLILIVIDVYLYLQTYSRMSCIVILLISILGLCHEKIKNWKIWQIVFIINKYLYGLFTVIILGIVLYFSNRTGTITYTLLNSILSDRLKFSIQYLHNYGIHPLGQSIQTITARDVASFGGSWSGIDCSYLMILIRYGFIMAIGLTILCIWFGKQLQYKKDIISAVIFFAFLIFSLTENCFYQIQNNFSLLILARELYTMKSLSRKTKGRDI